MNKLDKDYLALCADILENGQVKRDRTGTGTISVFDRNLSHNMADGFPLLTTKKMSLKTIATELRWFLNGDTNIRFLNERGCKIWNGDAYKRYLNECKVNDSSMNEWMTPAPVDMGEGVIMDHIRMYREDEFVEQIMLNDKFNRKWGDLGPIYGKQWRNWNGIDQIANLIHDLRVNPDSRRLMVNAWNVSDISKVVLPPCHYGFQCYTSELSIEDRWGLLNLDDVRWQDNSGQTSIEDEELHKICDNHNIPRRKLSLKWEQRSVDTALGLPYNIASYGMLLIILANEVGMVPHILSCSLGDTHLYLDHIEKIKEQMGVEMSTAERNQWFVTNWKGDKSDWEDFELDQQCVPKRTREPFPLAKLRMFTGINSPLDGSDFELVGYESHSAIHFPLSN